MVNEISHSSNDDENKNEELKQDENASYSNFNSSVDNKNLNPSV